MANPIKFPVFLLVTGLVAFASCEKPTPAPDPEPTVFADPANCFMVSEPGFYAFKANKGKTTEAVASIASVEVLWESFGTDVAPSKGNIIPQAYYKDGMVYFKTPTTLNDGNAVIAAKDVDNNILWSWHIWVCAGWNATATAQKYLNKNNGITSFGAVMDRNLGATSVAIDDIKSQGLLYQWGRKDPFLGWNGTDEQGHTRAASTLAWPEPAMSSAQVGTIEYAIAHPTTIIYPGKVSTNVDWYHTDVENTTDNTRWNEKKDLYDPCPAGWTLPRAHISKNEGLWYNALGEGIVLVQEYDKTHRGYNLTGILGADATIWYPFVSFYYYEDGNLYKSERVSIWSSDVPPVDASDPTAYLLQAQVRIAHDELEISAASHGYRAVAFPTRCVAVK